MRAKKMKVTGIDDYEQYEQLSTALGLKLVEADLQVKRVSTELATEKDAHLKTRDELKFALGELKRMVDEHQFIQSSLNSVSSKYEAMREALKIATRRECYE